MELKPSEDRPELTILRVDNEVEDEVLASSCRPRQRKLFASIGDMMLGHKIKKASKEMDFFYPYSIELSDSQLRRISRNVIGRVGNLDALPTVKRTRAEMGEQFSDYLYSHPADQ